VHPTSLYTPTPPKTRWMNTTMSMMPVHRWISWININLKPMQNGLGIRLEEWTNPRATKNWHGKQLRSFLKVSATIINEHLDGTDIAWQGRWHQRQLQSHGDGNRSEGMLETMHRSKYRWFRTWGCCPSCSRYHLQMWTASNMEPILCVHHIFSD